MRLSQPLMLSILLCVVLAPALHAAQTVDETRSANADARIEIENLAGSVQVTGWNRNEVHVTGTLGDDVEKLDISGSGDRISIEVKLPRGDGGYRDADAELEIHVPAGCQLEVETVSATIDAADLSGRVDLESVSGDVTLSGRPEAADVETVSGQIRITGAGTPVSAESVSGDIILTGVAGNIDVATVSSTIEVTADEIQQANIESVSGTVLISGPLAPGARLDLEAHSSDVTLAVPAGTSASFDITTFSGDVDNDFGPAAERTSEYTPGKELQFTIGSGDAQISIETFSGTVKLKEM